ncbi:MAG: 50S ribosomal protein L21e [Candidatus Micrarchaeia archaeon]
MKRSLGKLSKRSRLLGRRARARRLGTSALLKKFAQGERVAIQLRSDYPGMPHPRYRGRTGLVVGMQGDAYIVEIQDGRGVKRLTVPGVHLVKVGS